MNKQKQKEYEPQVIKLPIHASRVYMAHDVILYSSRPKPNRFRCFMLWLFFGWRWENCDLDKVADK